MERLSLLEKESLAILKQLEYFCELTESVKPEIVLKERCLNIKYFDIDFSVLKKRKNITAIETYLQKNGVPFYITSNFEFDNQKVFLKSYDQAVINTVIAEISGENLTEIKTKIRKLISELESSTIKDSKKVFKISFHIKNGTLQINEKNIDFEIGTIERTLLELLVQNDSEISWDTIMTEHDGIDYIMGDVSTEQVENSKKRCSDTKRRLNTKISKETIFNKDLVKQRKNHYSLTEKVTKK